MSVMRPAPIVAFILLVAAYCGRPRWPDIVVSPWFDELKKTESELAKTPVAYETYENSGRFFPEGLYADRENIYVWSSRHTRQIVLRRAGNSWKISGQRRGPLKTRRCIFIPDQNIGTVCLGAFEPGGLKGLDKNITFALASRAGYADFAYASGRFFVADSITEKIIILGQNGGLLGEYPAPGIYSLCAAGKNLTYLSFLNPRLVRLKIDGNKLIAAGALNLAAPVRDVFDDAVRDVVWTVGPKNETVTRKTGGIDNLASFVYAYKSRDITRGYPQPEISIDLARHGIVDAVSLTPAPRGMLVSSRGASAYALLEERGEDFQPRTFKTGDRGVSAIFYRDSQVFTTGFFSDTVRIFRADSGKQLATLNLNASPVKDPSRSEIGEYIFYSAALGRGRYENQFSCESCHWDRLGDHRIHHGGGGTRGLIRPARGVGMISYPMPDMEYDSISKLVEEFFKAMDYEFWSRPRLEEEHWHRDKIIFPESDTPLRVSGQEARLALLTYLMRLPVERPVLRQPGQALNGEALKGFNLFWRDCIRCHEPTTNMRGRNPLTREAALNHLRDKPLVFGAPLFMKTAITPNYTTHGTRVNPLTSLGRGGPYMTLGSAKNLGELIGRTNPKTNEVHFADGRGTFYSAAEISALTAFLLSI